MTPRKIEKLVAAITYCTKITVDAKCLGAVLAGLPTLHESLLGGNVLTLEQRTFFEKWRRRISSQHFIHRNGFTLLTGFLMRTGEFAMSGAGSHTRR
jgi:hypothetical protein